MACRGGASRPADIQWTCERCHERIEQRVGICANPYCKETEHELTLRCMDCDQRIRFAVPGYDWDGANFQPKVLELTPEIH